VIGGKTIDFILSYLKKPDCMIAFVVFSNLVFSMATACVALRCFIGQGHKKTFASTMTECRC